MLGLVPDAASAHGGALQHALIRELGIELGIWLVLLVVFFVALLRFGAKRKAPRTKAPWPVFALAVATLLGVEVYLLVCTALPFWRGYAEAQPTRPEAPLEIRVVAQQFVWNIHYPGPDGIFGKARADAVDEASNPLGLDAEDPQALDDIVLRNTLHLPVDREVLLRITSKDVVHSFSVPEFYVKRDAIPGLETRLLFTPTLTTDDYRTGRGERERDFEIVCSQLCGQAHYQMRGVVTVETPEAFETWLAGQSAALGGGEDPFWN